MAEEGWEWVVTGDIWPHLQGSFLEIVGGFGLAIVISLVCGFLAGFYKGFREYIVPSTACSWPSRPSRGRR